MCLYREKKNTNITDILDGTKLLRKQYHTISFLLLKKRYVKKIDFTHVSLARKKTNTY